MTAQLEADITAAIAAASDPAALEAVRVAALGKSGSISDLLKTLGSMSPDERRERGPLINGLRDRISTAIAERKASLEAAELDAKLAAERVDLTLPPPPERRGRVHPTMQVLDEIVAIFAEMGFGLAEGHLHVVDVVRTGHSGTETGRAGRVKPPNGARLSRGGDVITLPAEEPS